MEEGDDARERDRDSEEDNGDGGIVEDADFEKEEMDGEEEEEEGVQQMFRGSEEFMGELDGDDKFFELATDYEEEEFEDVDQEQEQEQEEDDREYLEECLNGMDYGESRYVEEGDPTALQNLDGLAGNGCSVSAGNCQEYIEREDTMDPIYKRTRARFSLTDMSLNQLETFLQESDEEEDFQTVAEKEEYEKFLRAVLKEDEESKEQPEQSSRKEDEDDEEEDTDFDVEIEEALESDDTTESVRRSRIETRKRPETREKKRRRAQLHSRGPLRHLLPHVVGSFGNDFPMRNTIVENRDMTWPINGRRSTPVSGFTANQIGQLYSQMHEHVQLLVQVHSLCVFDPTKEQIAKNTQGILQDLVKHRESVLCWKKIAFPDFCFRPPFTHSSLPIEGEKPVTLLHSMAPPHSLSPPDTTTYTSTSCGQSGRISSNMTFSHSLGQNMCKSLVSSPNERGKSVWAPIVSGPVRSLLDVAPLALVRDYLTNMSQVVQELSRRHVEVGASKVERVPIFAVTTFDEQDQSIARNFIGGIRAHLLGDVELMPASLPTPQVKKTMAAALVESTKKQDFAPVPKEVAIAVQHFVSYFNVAMFPHKPLPVSTTSRILFTEAEDELLAMGMMEFNHDWSSIQQRFLPSKTVHQVFVRQKNRTSSKALDNSIKAVHRMKASPLTDWERKLIQEGLNYFKHDWNKVWSHCVKHRDPATLQRQWRIAAGTQKSYKTSETFKERRRVYEASRRQKIAPQKREAVTDNWSVKSTRVPSGPTIASAERRKGPKKRKEKRQVDNRFSSSQPWLGSQVLNSNAHNWKHTVKLAPGLPSVKLPPHVQVLSQVHVLSQAHVTSQPQVQLQQSFSRRNAAENIVMEREELSDSEDEADAGVEFEHEEMGDSDNDAEVEVPMSTLSTTQKWKFQRQKIGPVRYELSY